MNDFTLPTNIKQIGSIGDGLRVYMEDYVCTYLFQYADAGGYNERVALLVGRSMVIDGQAILFINGAMQGKYTEEKDGLLTFTEKTGEYAEATIAEFFKGMEIVGWMQSQPSYGIYLNQKYAEYHTQAFPKEYHALFVMDPLEKINAFYLYNDDHTQLTEATGYFIYYDKNKNMQEYMLKNKAFESEYKTQIPAYIANPVERPEVCTEEEQPETIIRRRQMERMTKKTAIEQRRTLNLLVSLSAVLFVICFVMGAGLIQNQDRIAKMEDQIIQLSTAYRNLFLPISQDTGATSVFAAQTEDDVNPTDVPDNTQTPTPSPSPSQENPTANIIIEDGEANLHTETPLPQDVFPLIEIPTEGDTLDENYTAQTDTAQTDTTQADTVQTSSVPKTYTIQPGDNLNWISIHFYGDRSMVSEILTLNNIENPNMIFAGKTILLPQK